MLFDKSLAQKQFVFVERCIVHKLHDIANSGFGSMGDNNL